MKRFKNQKGVAYIMVIACLMFLTVIVTGFWSDTQMGHTMALNYKARVQSYYLAKSAINFSKLLLYYNKKIEDTLSKKKLTYADLGFSALYKQLPISSEFLRGMMTAGTTNTTGDVGGGDEETEEDSSLSQAKDSIGLLKKEEMESFLDFTGDFDAEITEEQSKYSINAVTKMTSTSSSYDLHKKILLSILKRDEFKNFFENQASDAETLVHSIADFVDSNSTINEFNKVERGSESSQYSDKDYKVKNAALLSFSELRLVDGMSDDIYETLIPLVTVYHASDKINICLAEEQIVDALIVHYTQHSECTSALDFDDKEEIDKLRETILANCPDKTAVAKSLNEALGISEPDKDDKPTTAESKSTSSKVSACKIQFEDLLTQDNKIFRIKGFGEVKGVKTVITMVLDASNKKASSWKVLYYQID